MTIKEQLKELCGDTVLIRIGGLKVPRGYLIGTLKENHSNMFLVATNTSFIIFRIDDVTHIKSPRGDYTQIQLFEEK